MSNQEILEKAIAKAIEGGWDIYGRIVNACGYDEQGDEWFAWYKDTEWPQTKVFKESELIFNHDFAKALWVKHEANWFNIENGQEMLGQLWQHHLQQMVIADDPVKYLGDNI